ncbi:MAG: outer membrane beta-barrel protein [Niabella sp.]
MKKGLLILAAVTSITVAANAQKGLGVQAGVNFSNIVGKNASDDLKMKAGFQAGVNYDIAIGDEFYVQPAVNYIQYGAKSDGLINATLKHNYIQVPITFQYQPTVGTGNLLLGVGPYVGFGVGDVKAESGGKTISGSFKDAGYNTVDAGAKFNVGYKLSNGVYAALNADLGLTDLHKDIEKTRNAAFGVSVGFKF